MDETIAQLHRRIDELEARFAFQEHSVQALNEALTESRLETARYAQLLKQVLEELRNQRTGLLYGNPADEPPPPHY